MYQGDHAAMAEESHIKEYINRLLEADSSGEILDATAAATEGLLDADTGHIITIDDDALDVVATTEDELSAREDLPVATDVVGQLDLIGRSHVFDDISDVRSVAAQSADAPAAGRPRSLLVAPIEGAGMLVATARTPGTFDESDRAWAEQLAGFTERLLADEASTSTDAGSDDRLERIATVLSHDFNGPLTVARGSLELAEETGEGEHFDRAHAAIDRIEHLVTGIERMADDDATFPCTELVELRRLVEEVWPSIDGAATADLTVEDSRAVLADEHALSQLLMNLLANAVDHGGDRVTVGTIEDGFFVEDDGEGIPPAQRDAVFEWGHTAVADNKGIGLCIAEQIADVHGWSIAVVDGTDGGARFEITGIDE